MKFLNTLASLSKLLLILYIVKVNIPFGIKVTYDNVCKINLVAGGSWQLWLDNGKEVFVPSAFTIIEEK